MNPKIREFLNKNKDISLLGLAWSLFWRLYAVFILVTIIVALLLEA